MLSELNDWLNNKAKNFDAGVKLLQQFNIEKNTAELCLKFGKNSFTEGKLLNAIETTYKNLLANTKPPVKIETVKTGSKISTPVANPLEETDKDTIIRLMEEKSGLFKEVLDLRKQLKKTHPLLYRGTIDLGSALAIMDTYDRKGRAVPFSIVCVTYNETQSTGGEILHYHKAQLAVLDKSNRIAEGPRVLKLGNKNPNHWGNGTRNIRPYDDNQIRKINIWLILQFNEMEVTLGNIG
jgi:hypothetical protein